MPNNTEKIWLQFSDQLKSFISRQVSEKSVVDDILQDVFVKIHSRIDTLNDDLKIRGWIYQIARNTIIDHYRKKKIKSEDIDLIGNVDDDFDAGPAQKIADGLKEMVSDLPEKYAEALLLTEFQGLSQNELAQKIGLSLSAAKSRVQRARAMLKDSLMKCCHFEFDQYGTIIDYHPITCCCCHRN
ncbi:RNA polymerase sigma factor SigZ [candidate division KSB1 bacterium RBG_16_48_16]|nr:MAG: RNA polymerase sigma factor SigZ [candidate division KSB1 bacterium RBG_16_48_16]